MILDRVEEFIRNAENGDVIYFPMEASVGEGIFVIDVLPGESKRKARRRNGMVKGKSK
uniref:Uncharacterized protein n=1 Tax=Ochrobactrum phage ORM_20 TaxID=2985243 RepID=A0A9N6WRZ7_9VIRU|nr:hypothetical protein ORM20_00033 [Ochrobactrum phage ORM_20]